MSLERAANAIRNSVLSANDRTWFPRWLGKLAAWLKVGHGGELPITRDSLIGFLQAIKKQGKPAWQRLQVVQAVEFYASQVLKRDEPWLAEIADRLRQAAQAERAATPRQSPRASRIAFLSAAYGGGKKHEEGASCGCRSSCQSALHRDKPGWWRMCRFSKHGVVVGLVLLFLFREVP